MQQGYYYIVGQHLDELASEDSKKRLNSVEHLMQIAKAFGPERTKTELIEFLKELLYDDEEIQEAFAIQIHKLVGFLGKDSIKSLMFHIEKLFTSEDSKVRKAILQSLHRICKEYNLKDEEILRLAKRLFESPVFSAKISSVMIICRLNKYISQSKIRDILDIITSCTKSKVPQVRRAVAANLKYLLRSIPKLQSDGLEFLRVLSRDHIDSIRVNTVESIVFQVYDKRTFSGIVWPLLKPLFEDPSWRVRLACIFQIGDICKSAGTENTKRNILPYYAKFMVDSETELKNAAALHLRTLVKFLQPDDIINKITPIIKTLANDKHSYVRTSLASSVLSLAPVLGRKATNQHILSFFIGLLRDDCAEVRIAIFRSFHELTQVIPASTLIQTVMPVFLDLGNDKNWKNRVQCLETLLVFERELGTSFVNDKKIIELIMGRMSDKVFTVRQSAIDTVKNLSKKLGSSWAEKHAIPIIKSFQDNKNFLYRMNFYSGIKALAPFLSSSTLGKLALKIIELSKSEKVPNIKVVILQSLREIQKIHKDKKIEDKIKTVYHSYSSDVDSDVKYFAKVYSSKP